MKRRYPFSRWMAYSLLGIFLNLGAMPLYAANSIECVLAAGGELFIPGLGYAILGHFDKMFVLGGLRWATINKYASFSASKDFEKDPENIYLVQKKEDGTKTTDVFLSRETFYADVYGSLYTNLTFVTFYDLYDEACEPNQDTYVEMLAPFNIGHWGGSLKFWIPTGVVALAASGYPQTTYHIDEDLTQDEMLRWSFLQFQLVGIGEEMLFRGVIQNSLFHLLSNPFSKGFARWSSIVLGASIFAVAHNGEGFSANPQGAFVGGILLGWIYHPAEGDFDLETAIAVHSWWDTILMQQNLSKSKFVSRKPGENAKNTQTASAYIPLFYYATRF